MTKDRNCRGVFIDEENPNVPILMYADDIVIVGDRIGDVQKILDCLDMYCEKWRPNVNIEKTKLIDFRNEGTIKRYEFEYFRMEKIDC